MKKFQVTSVAAGIFSGLFVVGAALAAAPANQSPSANVRSALAGGHLGLFPAADFRLVEGACADCTAPREALWYFRNDLVAIPNAGVTVAGYSAGVRAQDDVRAWYAKAGAPDLQARPPLVWIGSPNVVADAKLQPSGNSVRFADGTDMQFAVAAKIPTNLSYYDSSSAKFFEQRPLRIRGSVAPGPNGVPVLTARTIWPQDYVIDAGAGKAAPLGAGESLTGLVRDSANMSRYETRVLWERNPGQPRRWGNLAALGVMLNGAQGDDDEAHGGHFAIVTGHSGERGEWGDWLVNNFYNLDSFSEKGIVAAMVPMDNYLMDLNSGQAYYRPSYMLVALMRSDRAAYAYQSSIARVYRHFYQHDFRYRHAGANCAGVSIDTLRSLGWNIPTRGATSYVKAVAAYPYMALKEQSFDSGRKSFDYMSEEQTRLYPAVAFDAAGNDLLQLVGASSAATRAFSAFEESLRNDIEAIIFVRIPQIPSSRATGTFPVASIDEYMQRAPADRAQWKIVPVEPRPFPAEFATAGMEPERQNNGALPVGAGLLIAGMVCARVVRSRRARKPAADQ